jgi:hypothetical protein
MNNFLAKTKVFFQKLRARFPSPVPQGVEEFENWAKSIIDLYGFPDNDSVRFAVATMILHSGPSAAYVPKHYWATMIKAGAAKQVASQVFQDIKTKQQAAQLAAAKPAEATATPVASNDAHPIQET